MGTDKPLVPNDGHPSGRAGSSHSAEAKRKALVREAKGKYKGMFSSVDDFLRERHEENEAEERNR